MSRQSIFLVINLLVVGPSAKSTEAQNFVEALEGDFCPLEDLGSNQALPNFPTKGTINVLVVFVQQKGDYYEHCREFNPTTGEWEDEGNHNIPEDIPTIPCYRQPDIPSVLESWTDDEATEWPALRSRGPDRTLPAWAENYLAEPGTDPSEFAEGSLSEYYYLNSNGKLKLTGYVYPKVFIPDTINTFYKEHPSGYPNGGSFLPRTH